MDIVKINKVLANKTRLDIIRWLKKPEQHFPPHKELKHFDFGVCGLFIQGKTGLSQSTISLYLSTMEKADLLIPTRIGKWTYFKRNEKTIATYLAIINKDL
jgi:ArsR family transcriptional regulator